jgi:hypothetical protein
MSVSAMTGWPSIDTRTAESGRAVSRSTTRPLMRPCPASCAATLPTTAVSNPTTRNARRIDGVRLVREWGCSAARAPVMGECLAKDT